MEKAILKDIKKLGWCHKGVREVMKHFGVDWGNFIKNGIPLEFLDSLNDYQASQLANQARKRIKEENK